MKTNKEFIEQVVTGKTQVGEDSNGIIGDSMVPYDVVAIHTSNEEDEDLTTASTNATNRSSLVARSHQNRARLT